MSRSPLTAAIVTVRPHQWVKNLFVAAPLVFSKHLLDADVALRAAIALALFCAVSGAVYALNDARDADADRQHPLKQRRPIAAGDLSERAGLLMAVGLATLGLVGSSFVSPMLALVLGGYLLNNLAYSLGLKHVAVLDVLMIVGGFLLRVVGGAIAIDVPASPFLLVCTGLLAGLLGFGKRAHELIHIGDESGTRKSLAGYRRRSLTIILVVLAIATSAAYAVYTQTERTVALFQTRALIWTLPFCIVGIGRYLMLALSAQKKRSPTESMLRDPLFIINMLLWSGAVFTIVYGDRLGVGFL